MRWSVRVLETEMVSKLFGRQPHTANVRGFRKLFRTAGFRDFGSEKSNKFFVEHDSIHAMLLFQIQNGCILADCVIDER